MPEEELKNELLKQDTMGRVRVPAQRREALLDEFERCGVSAVEFALQIGVKYQTFATWRQRRSRQIAAIGSPSVVALPPVATSGGMRWVEAVMEGEAGEPGTIAKGSRGVLVVTLPGGARMEIGDATQVRLAAELLKALGNGGVC
jgi:hypothetical protein